MSKTGRSQANRLAKWFAKEEVSGVLSSPYARCVQTVEPLAERSGRPVERVAELAEGSPFEKAIELLDDLPDHAVICTHGDVMLETIGGLVLAGMEVKGRPDFRKAAFQRTMDQDIAVVVRTQRGLNAIGLPAGVHASKLEERIGHFERMWARAMTDEPASKRHLAIAP